MSTAATLPPAPAANVEVLLQVTAPEVLSGADLPVLVRLRNNMQASGFTVISPEADHPFLYHLITEKKEEVLLSHDLFQQKTHPHPAPPREQELAPLLPGSTVDYPFDLARLMTAPLSPGTYRLYATYALQGQMLQSAPVTLHVVPPRVSLLENAPDGSRVVLGSVLVHQRNEKPPVLYHRESYSGLPDVGVYRPLVELKGLPGSLALATDAEAAKQQRWVGWTVGHEATFLQVWDKAVLYTSPPVQLPEGARLISPGWTFNDGRVLFLAVSPKGFALVTLPGRQTPRVQAYPEAGVPVAAAQVRASAFRTATGESRILAVWNDGTRLMCSILNPAGGATPPRVLVERPEPLIALDIETVALETAPGIAALFSAGRPGESAFLVTLKPGETPHVSTVAPVPGDTLHCAVLADTYPAVTCADGARLHTWGGTSQTWTTAETGSEIAAMRLVRMFEPWLVWSAPGQGVRFRKLQP